jgi:hypothetical protein
MLRLQEAAAKVEAFVFGDANDSRATPEAPLTGQQRAAQGPTPHSPFAGTYGAAQPLSRGRLTPGML